jgi:maltose phosphorylase
MKHYITHDPWKIIEDGFHPEYNRISESLFSIGNGRMGQRANFEETFTGETLQGHYVAGVYYPDKTRVGWWKNGYPEYFAKVLNAPSWIEVKIEIEGEELNLHTAVSVSSFRRELNMQEGYLRRSCAVELQSGKKVKIDSLRFCSMQEDECGALNYTITPLNFSCNISFTLPADGNIKNADANYDEKFWNQVFESAEGNQAFVITSTKKTLFQVCTGIQTEIKINNQPAKPDFQTITREKYAALHFSIYAEQGKPVSIIKYAAILSSMNHGIEQLLTNCKIVLQRITEKGFDQLLQAQKNIWAKKWEDMDIMIEGDVAAQQGIRFNIFQLHQTYTGEDERLNIGPKGFTGEKYGGSTYWDTEAYCLPFYLSTAEQKVARNLLLYRYKHLPKAIENAAKLGFHNGAALYPMVTMNGEECHNEWEITFEEIHRNGAIAYAIWNYCQYTNDWNYLTDYGVEVLIAIARFWVQRANWSSVKNQYVMLGVTGPNEYENNVNNNWYTNYLASWCLEFAETAINIVKEKSPDKLNLLLSKIHFKEEDEIAKWKYIREKMFLPEDDHFGIFLQQEGYLDKEQVLVSDLPAAERPLNQKWSWDRILRSCFIKQADVLQGIYLFEDRFDMATIQRNFEFYERRTVHESSLSPCIHSILAAKVGNEKKAYEMYLRTARLDLDDYNNDTEDGCHVTSMAGTWMSIVQGFAGMRVKNNNIYFNPFIPDQWKAFQFNVLFRGAALKIKVTQKEIFLENHGKQKIEVFIFDQPHVIEARESVTLSH